MTVKEVKSIKKSCFVIAPIGEAKSSARNRSDKILKHIIKPIVMEAGYAVKRADEIDHPGMITAQIINHIINDDLVIADLTDHNPNVFYELALRHAIRKPIIHLIQNDQKLPFDISDSRTIFVDHTDLDSVEECRQNMQKQIASLEKNPEQIDSPISHAIDLQRVMQKDNNDSVNTADLLVLMKDLKSDIQELNQKYEMVDVKLRKGDLERRYSYEQEFRDSQDAVRKAAKEIIRSNFYISSKNKQKANASITDDDI